MQERQGWWIFDRDRLMFPNETVYDIHSEACFVFHDILEKEKVEQAIEILVQALYEDDVQLYFKDASLYLYLRVPFSHSNHPFLSDYTL